MGNKEIKRTVMKMFSYRTVLICLIIHLSFALATETKTENATNLTVRETNSTTSPQPVAEPLIRYRRQPPRTIVKLIRPKRIKVKRVKRPKIRYSFAEPPPTYYRGKPSFSSHKAPTFDSSMLEGFSHYNMESADFDLPPSSYEAQTMDLDLYKHYEAPAESSYKEIQNQPSYEYAAPEVSYKEPETLYKEIQNPPSYSYAAPEGSYKAPEISYKESSELGYKGPEVSYKEPAKTYSYIPTKNSETRKPHPKYGVPTEFDYSTGYDKPTDNKYSYETHAYEPPASFKPHKPIYEEIEKPSFRQPNKNEYTHSTPSKNEYSYSIHKGAPPRIPATKYGVPDVHIPNDYNKYSVIEQKPSYASYPPTNTDKYNFAEPPQPEPNVEITYSPSYEINIPPLHENTYPSGKYNVEHQLPPSHEEPTQQYHPQPPNYDQSPKYEDSPQQYDASSKYHPPTNYQEPSNKYETPKYQSPSQQNFDQHSGYQEVSDSNQPSSYHPAPPRHVSISEYIPKSQDLPIDVNHKQPSYGFPKSSYEVPIYDPIPFDSSNNQQHEVYPPQTFDHSQRQQNSNTEFVAEPNNISEHRPPHQHQPESEESPAGDAHSSGTRPLPQSTSQKPISPITRLRKTYKRKRNRGSSTTVSTTKHILDVPELEQAFENDKRNQLQHEDADTNESHKVQKINFNSGPWNPMKIRTSPTITAPPNTTSATNTLNTNNKQRYHYKQTSTTTTTTTKPPSKVEIVSIEKSRSKSYYDGILSTPRVYNANLFRNRYKIENSTTASPPQQMVATNENKFSKRTTKNVFDTTVFKSPLNDRDIYHNLPKNHKLF